MMYHRWRYFVVIMCMAFSPGLFAQPENTSFIESYKRFRSLVDDQAVYDIYIVPDSGFARFLVNDLEPEMKEAFHFLRKKTTVKKEADFSVAVLVDQLGTLTTYSDMTEEAHYTTGINRTYKLVQPYRLTISLSVSGKDKTVTFPLCVGKEFRKEVIYGTTEVYPRGAEKVVTRVVNGVSVTTTVPDNTVPPRRPFIDSYETALKKIQLNKNDLREAFRQLLIEYRNYYVDRVD